MFAAHKIIVFIEKSCNARIGEIPNINASKKNNSKIGLTNCMIFYL